jgi:hypothetical protein
MSNTPMRLQGAVLRVQLPVVLEVIRAHLRGALVHEEDAELVTQALVVRLLIVLEVLGILQKLAELI